MLVTISKLGLLFHTLWKIKKKMFETTNQINMYHYNSWYTNTLRYITLPYVTSHDVTLHCIALHGIAWHCIAYIQFENTIVIVIIYIYTHTICTCLQHTTYTSYRGNKAAQCITLGQCTEGPRTGNKGCHTPVNTLGGKRQKMHLTWNLV